MRVMRGLVALVISIFLSTATFAYSLADFPAAFVHEGVPAPNLAIVVGDTAAASDVVGAIDIAIALQIATSGKVSEELQQMPSRAAAPGGNALQVSSAGHLFAVNDYLGNVREALTENDLDMLRGGTIVTNARATKYHQYLRFPSTTGQFLYDLNGKSVPDEYLEWQGGDKIFEWEIDFEQGLVSQLNDNDLSDLRDKELSILGQPMVIVDTDFTPSTGRLVLKLMGGALAAILGENDKQTYTVEGRTYTVEVVGLSTSANNGKGSVKFRINDELSEELKQGSITTLSDGTYLGIRDILPTNKDIQKSVVEFYLGAHALVLEDRKITDSLGTSGGATIDGKVIPTASVEITGSTPVANQTVSIDSVHYVLNAEPLFGDLYVPPTAGVSEFLKNPQGMLVPGWDIYNNGLQQTGESMFRVVPVSDYQYKLDFINQEGIHYTVPFLTAQNNCLRYGNDNNDLWFIESNAATTYYGTLGDAFVLSTCDVSTNKDTCMTHVVKYKSVDTSGMSSGTLRLYFTDLGTGNTDVALSLNGGTYQGTLSVGDGQYAINANPTLNSNGAPNISIDLNGDGAFSNGKAVIGMQGDGLFDLGSINTNETNQEGRDARTCTNPTLKLRTLSKEFDKASGDEVIPITIESRAGNRIGMQTLTTATSGYFSGLKYKTLNQYQGLSGYGIFFEFYNPGNHAETLAAHYPLSQRGANVLIGQQGGGRELATVQEALATGQQTPIAHIVKFVSEIHALSDYNAILVGGACANPLVAQLQRYPQPCWQSIAQGVGLVQAYEHANGNVALLVAGRSAQDTRRAAIALSTGKLKMVHGSVARVTQGLRGEIKVLGS